MTDTLTFTFDSVEPDETAVKVYLPRELRDDFMEFMEGNGVSTSQRIEAAFGIDDAIVGLAAAAVYRLLVKVLPVYLVRHQHKKVVVKAGDTEFEVSGMSPVEMASALSEVLEVVEERQKKADESWHRILEEMPDPPKQLPPDDDPGSPDGDQPPQ